MRTKPRLVVGPANIALAPEFVLIDTYAKAVDYFGEREAERYRVIFEDPTTTAVLRMRPRFDEEKPPAPRVSGKDIKVSIGGVELKPMTDVSAGRDDEPEGA